MNNIIRVIIADDFEIIREGIKRVLDFEENIRVVGEAVNGDDALSQVKLLKPDILLLDMSMPKCSGIDLLKKIKEEKVKVKVIVLTVENKSEYINSAIEAGAAGYVVKESTTAEIVEAINTVYKGEKYLDKSLVSLMFDQYGQASKSSAFDELTKREIDIVYFLSKGSSNSEIANTLYLSEKTIKNNLTKVFKKLNVKDRVQLAIMGINENIEKFYRD